MPINLPEARRRLEGIRQCATSALDTQDRSDKDYYLRDIQTYALQLALNIEVSVEEPVTDEVDATETAALEAGQQLQREEMMASIERAREAMMAARPVVSPEWLQSSTTSARWATTTGMAATPQVIQWVPDETIAALNDEPRDDAFDGVDPAEEL